MLQKFQQHINTDFSFLKNKKLLIAISGGVDSVVLAHLLSQLKFDISLAHCNFNLRGDESIADEQFVVELGNQLNILTCTTSFNTEKTATENKQSTQVAARNLRYTWFDELRLKYDFDYILTAHHADDNLETFLINFTRGSGLDGLTGIPTTNGYAVRPLLVFSRDEIIQFATENSVNWREDQSNASTKYLRNKIRHQILPILKEINPSMLNSFQKTIHHLQESQEIIKDRVEDISRNSVEKLDAFQLNSIPDLILKINVLQLKKLSNPKAYLYQLLKDYHFTEWEDVTHLLEAQSGKQVFSKTHRLLKDRGFLLLSKIHSNVSSSAIETFFIKENTSKITKPLHLEFKSVTEISNKNTQIIYLDKEQLLFPLILRKWQKGDFFHPMGMQGKKKLSKFFKDEKYSLLEKESTWILCSEKEIIWIVGKKQSRYFLPTPKTKNLLKISQVLSPL